MMESLQSLIEQIEPLAKGPIFLPPAHTKERAFPAVAATMTGTTLIYLASFLWANRVIKGPAADKSVKATTFSVSKEVTADRRRLCYQITNISTNLFPYNMQLVNCCRTVYITRHQ